MRNLSVPRDGRVDDDYWFEVDFDLDGGWSGAAVFRKRHGHPVLLEVRLHPTGLEADEGFPLAFSPAKVDELVTHAPYGITASVLRSIRIEDLVTALRARTDRMHGHDDPGAWSDRSPEMRRAIARAKEEPLEPGKGGRKDLNYALWAWRYVEKLTETSKPVAALAREHDKDPEQVRDLVHKARERGFLTATQRGKPGGELTAKGMAVLMGEEASDGVDS